MKKLVAVFAFICLLIPFNNLFASDFRWDNDLLYDVAVGLKPIVKGSQRKDHFYRSSNNKITLYDPWSEYYFSEGTFPCSPEGAKESMNQKQKRKYFESKCPLNLFAHTKNGITKIANIQLSVSETDVCGSIRPIVNASHDPISAETFFVSTMGKSGSKTFIDSSAVRIEKPNFFSMHQIKIPKGIRDIKFSFYQYPRGSSQEFIVIAKGEVWAPTIDEEKFGTDRYRTWYGAYLLTKEKISALLPEDIHKQFFYTEQQDSDLELFGFEDVNVDGELDIILGSKASMILERYGSGFRAWTFAFFPPGGC